MKFALLSFAVAVGSVAANCAPEHCGDWACTAPAGQDSWCECFDETDETAGAYTPFCPSSGDDSCACPSCTANVASDTCGKNGGAICDGTFCASCDNPGYGRRSNGACAECGHRFREPCNDGSGPTCNLGTVCTTHSCFVETAAHATPSQQEPIKTAATTWVGLCQVCGANGTPICEAPFSDSPNMCTPGQGLGRRSNGNCGICGNRFHEPCPGTGCSEGLCNTHSCFVMDATTAPGSKVMGAPGITLANTYEGLCEICGSNGSSVCEPSVSPDMCTPGQGLGRRSNGNCGQCGKRFHEPCATTGCEGTMTVETAATVSLNQQEPVKTWRTTWVGLCNL